MSDFNFLILEKRNGFGQIGNSDFIVVFTFPFHLKADSMKIGGVPDKYEFYNCVFKKKVTVSYSERNIRFEECLFEEEFTCNDSAFKAKIRIRKCVFNKTTNFKNTRFHDLADFWRSEFKQETIFYKTDFLGTVVFSATVFEKNVLFTYTLIEKLILFRGAVIKKGIDLSTAIISGSIGTFGLELGDFDAKQGILSDEEFETAVSKKGEIPIKNKRETFRILKQANIQQNNVIESIPYQVLEKRTLLSELLISLCQPSSSTERWRSSWDLFILGLNWISNYFGKAPIQGVFFTVCIGAFFFYLSITRTGLYEISWNLESEILKTEIPNFFKFLLPTHGVDYLGPEYYLKDKLSNWYYVWDILGRIFVGYGIYQTIQAFRKFR